MTQADRPSREIFASAEKLTVLLVLCGLVLAAGLWVLREPGADNWLAAALLIAAALWFGARIVTRLMHVSTAVVTLDSDGVLDRRVANDPIRWAIVDAVQPVKYRARTTGALLVLSDKAYAQLPRSTLGALFEPLRSFLAPVAGVTISGFGLQVTGEELYNLCLAYSRSHKVQDEPIDV